MASVSTFGLSIGGSALFGASACAFVCSALVAGSVVVVPGLCYSDHTTMFRLANDGSEMLTSINDIMVGDFVKTFDRDSKLTWTRVVSNTRT